MDNFTETGTTTQEKLLLDTVEPWKIIFHNDDRTSFDLVIFILVTVFTKTFGDAEELALKVHNNGYAIVAVYDYEIAEQKLGEAIEVARSNHSQLQITIEQ